jgi:protein-L-isoaspartate(D-aspartate) O-methyltransferase
MALVPTDAGRGLRAAIARSTGAAHPRILEAFERVPREAFIPAELLSRAYEDHALPIGLEQTISQPSMIALMLIALDISPRHRVLEVGSGSGYVLALLSELRCEVYGVERLAALAERSRETLRSLGISDVVVKDGDGSAGVPEHAPYDRILVSAAASQIPDALVAELREGGRLVMPVGNAERQTLVTCERDDKGTLHYRAGAACVFVPLISDRASD